MTDPDAIREMVQSAVEAGIPEAGQRITQPWLDMARNELAEVICHAALEEIYDAKRPAKRVRHKEVPGLMSRGMDALALRENGAPPQGMRVGDDADSLHAQLRSAVADRSRVTAEL